MGCDIHGLVEYRRRTGDEYQRRWRTLIRDGYLPRDYYLFGKLAGVRGDGPPVAAPRGFPDDADWDSRERFMYRIAYGRPPEHDEVSPENAKRYHGYGSPYWGEYRPMGVHTTTFAHDSLTGESKTSENYQFKNAEFDGAPLMVQQPDWHTPSWVTTAELVAALGDSRHDVTYHAWLAAMQRAEVEGYEARFVFWFDN